MKHTLLFATLATFFAATHLTSVAYAQTEKTETTGQSSSSTEAAHPFGVRVGLARYSDSRVSDAVGDDTISFGLSYYVPTRSRKVQFRIDADYLRSSDSSQATPFPVPGNDLIQNASSTAYGLTANALFPLGKSAAKGAYAGLGFGVYRSRYKVNFSTDGPIPQTISNVSIQQSGAALDHTETKLSGKLLLGYRFNHTFFGELGYTQIGDANGGEPSYYGLQLGANF